MEENSSGMQATDWDAASRAAQRCLAEAKAAATAYITEKANEERRAAEHGRAQALLALQQQWEGIQKTIEKEKRIVDHHVGQNF